MTTRRQWVPLKLIVRGYLFLRTDGEFIEPEDFEIVDYGITDPVVLVALEFNTYTERMLAAYRAELPLCYNGNPFNPFVPPGATIPSIWWACNFHGGLGLARPEDESALDEIMRLRGTNERSVI